MKLNILFLLYKAKTNSTGKCPVRCRITYNNSRKEFSTGIFINPKNWLSKEQVIKPDEPDANLKETQMSLISAKNGYNEPLAAD
jgi:hypothetical protein